MITGQAESHIPELTHIVTTAFQDGYRAYSIEQSLIVTEKRMRRIIKHFFLAFQTRNETNTHFLYNIIRTSDGTDGNDTFLRDAKGIPVWK